MVQSIQFQLDQFFKNKPKQRALFDLVQEVIGSNGQVNVKVTKSQISFSNKRQFAWVWLPMKWDKNRPKDSIIISFSLGEKIIHPKIVQVVEPYHNRFMHHSIIENKSDVSTAVKLWLKKAHIFGSRLSIDKKQN